MTADVRSLAAQRDREQRRRDNQLIEVAENATADWSTPTSNDSKRRNSR